MSESNEPVRALIRPARFALAVVGLVAVVAATVHLPVLVRKPSNTDELIYLSLAQSLVLGQGYTLQGTRILSGLPPEMYDHAIFNHPPGFPILLMPFVQAGVPTAATWVSLLAAMFAAGAVAWVGYRLLLGEEDSLVRRMLFVILLLAAFFDPLMSFCSRRVWMDNVLAMWVAFAFAAILSSDAARLRGSVFAGLFLAAAVATKLMTIVFLLPLMIGLVLCDRSCQFSVKPSSDASAQRRFLWMKISLLSLPALVVVCLWEIWFFRATGHWLPDWLAIDDAVLRKHPFMAARADQPPLYFPAKFFLLCPLALLVVVPASARVFKFGGQGKAILKTTLLAIVLYLAVLVYLGERGFSKEARYLTPVMPLLGMLFADGLAHLAKRQLRTRDQIYLMACVLAILAGAMLSGFYLFVPSVDEPLSAWGLLFGTW